MIIVELCFCGLVGVSVGGSDKFKCMLASIPGRNVGGGVEAECEVWIKFLVFNLISCLAYNMLLSTCRKRSNAL